MESRKIKDSQIIASTETVANRAIYGRLHLRFHPIYHREIQSFLSGAWTASRNDVDQWIQVDLASYTKVTGVATQGRSFGNDWVTKYKLQYSNNGVRFYSYKAPGQRSAKVLITTTHVMFSSKQDCGGGGGGGGKWGRNGAFIQPFHTNLQVFDYQSNFLRLNLEKIKSITQIKRGELTLFYRYFRLWVARHF